MTPNPSLKLTRYGGQLARTLDGRNSPAAPPAPQEKIDGVE